MKKTSTPWPKLEDRAQRAKTRPRAVHQENPAGTKIIKGFLRSLGQPETLANVHAYQGIRPATRDAPAYVDPDAHNVPDRRSWWGRLVDRFLG